MRMLFRIGFNTEAANAKVMDGSLPGIIKSILDRQNPEAAYFTADHGKRTAFIVVDLKQASDIPMYAEPWFLTFNASIDVYPVMTPDDLAKAGLDKMG
jgi:hypothetical protein